jgi:hypothetical protein
MLRVYHPPSAYTTRAAANHSQKPNYKQRRIIQGAAGQVVPLVLSIYIVVQIIRGAAAEGI